jgi:hypothetical protein
LPTPVYEAFAVAVPTFTFDVYVTFTGWLSPGPVTFAVHGGAIAEPVNTADAGHDTVVVVTAGVI